MLFSFLFFLLIIRSGGLANIRWSVCISKSHRSRTDTGLCIYYLFILSNLNFWHNSKWITFPIQSCLVLSFFPASLLHSLNMWLIVSSSLSPHNLHLLFWCILSIIVFVWLVLMALFCAAIWRDSVFLLRFPFLSHVHTFSEEIPLVSRLKRR